MKQHCCGFVVISCELGSAQTLAVPTALTPVAEIRRNYKEILGVGQVSAEDLSIYLFTLCRQRSDHDGHNGELALATETTKEGVLGD